MRRIRLIFAVTAAMATLTAMTAAPAMADHFDFDDDDIDFDDGIGFIGVGGFDFDDDFGALEFEQEDVESGDVAPVVDISNTGSSSNVCTTVVQSANTGNVLGAQGALLGGAGGFGLDFDFDFDDDFDINFDDGDLDDLEFEGSDITIAPAASGSCTQAIEQAAAVGVDS